MSKKNFCILQIMIVSMLVICLLANTYAWSNRGSQSGNELELKYESSVNGKIEAEQVITYLTGSGSSVEITNYQKEVSFGQVLRFVTEVTNTGSVPCNVSLLLKDVSFGSGFTVRVSTPTREYRVYEQGVTNGWVRVVPSCEIGAGKTETFEWSIEVTGSGELTIGEVVLENF